MWIYFSSKEASDWCESWSSLLSCKDKSWSFKLSHIVWENMAINSKTRREKRNTLCCCGQQKYCSQCLVKRIRFDLIWFLILCSQSVGKISNKSWDKFSQVPMGELCPMAHQCQHMLLQGPCIHPTLISSSDFCWLFLKDKLGALFFSLRGETYSPQTSSVTGKLILPWGSPYLLFKEHHLPGTSLHLLRQRGCTHAWGALEDVKLTSGKEKENLHGIPFFFLYQMHC